MLDYYDVQELYSVSLKIYFAWLLFWAKKTLLLLFIHKKLYNGKYVYVYIVYVQLVSMVYLFILLIFICFSNMGWYGNKTCNMQPNCVHIRLQFLITVALGTLWPWFMLETEAVGYPMVTLAIAMILLFAAVGLWSPLKSMAKGPYCCSVVNFRRLQGLLSSNNIHFISVHSSYRFTLLLPLLFYLTTLILQLISVGDCYCIF